MLERCCFIAALFIFIFVSFGSTSATWALKTEVSVLQRASAARAGRHEARHVAQMEVGLVAVGEGAGAQKLGFPLCIRAPG